MIGELREGCSSKTLSQSAPQTETYKTRNETHSFRVWVAKRQNRWIVRRPPMGFLPITAIIAKKIADRSLLLPRGGDDSS